MNIKSFLYYLQFWRLKITNGTTAAPALTFAHSDSTGLWSSAPGEVRVSIEDTDAFVFDSTGLAGPTRDVSNNDSYYATTSAVNTFVARSYASLYVAAKVLVTGAGPEIANYTAAVPGVVNFGPHLTTDASLGRITAVTAGTYRVTVMVDVQPTNDTGFRLTLYKNGSTWTGRPTLNHYLYSVNESSLTLVRLIDLEANDWITVAYLNTTRNVTATHLEFTVERVR